MKVLTCVSEYPPEGSGIANVAHHIITRMKRSGHQIEVCSPTGPDLPIETVKGYGRLGLFDFWCGVGKRFQNGVDMDYDAVWLHNPLFFYGSPFKSACVTIHTTSLGQIRNRVYPMDRHIYKMATTVFDNYCLRKMKGNSNRFIAISESVQNELQNIGIHSEIVYNGTDTKFFRPRDNSEMREKLGISVDSTVLISVGRLTEMKRPLILLEYFHKLQRTFPDVHLLLVGKGELKERVNDYVRANGINNVHQMGFVDDATLSHLYSCSDIYFSTSKYEGLSLTLLDAMASGLPIIGPNIGSFSVVKTADCGILCDFEDPASFEQVMSFVAKDTSAQGDNGRRFAMDQLDWDKITERYVNILSSR